MHGAVGSQRDAHVFPVLQVTAGFNAVSAACLGGEADVRPAVRQREVLRPGGGGCRRIIADQRNRPAPKPDVVSGGLLSGRIFQTQNHTLVLLGQIVWQWPNRHIDKSLARRNHGLAGELLVVNPVLRRALKGIAHDEVRVSGAKSTNTEHRNVEFRIRPRLDGKRVANDHADNRQRVRHRHSNLHGR